MNTTSWSERCRMKIPVQGTLAVILIPTCVKAQMRVVIVRAESITLSPNASIQVAPWAKGMAS